MKQQIRLRTPSMPSASKTRSMAVKSRNRKAIKQQVRHSRPLHRRFLLHPATIFMLLVAGVLIAGWTLKAAASDYSITAKVPADPLTDGAVITNPADGFTTVSSPITVTGTCPDGSYVKLYRNSVFSGVAGCTVSNDFTISTSLSAGINILQAQDYNITDDPGPTTDAITVTYNPPAPPPPPPSSSGSSSGQQLTSTQPPLSVASDYHYQAFTAGTTASWQIDISGGVIPYHIHTEWGDSKTSDQDIPAAATVTLTHIYDRAGYYVVKVFVTDHTPKTVLFQLIAFIKSTSGASGGIIVPGGGTTTGNSSSGTNLFSTIFKNGADSWLWVAWPTYITVVLMVVSFWLGERQIIATRMQRKSSSRPHPTPRR